MQLLYCLYLIAEDNDLASFLVIYESTQTVNEPLQLLKRLLEYEHSLADVFIGHSFLPNDDLDGIIKDVAAQILHLILEGG
jgi:hypothetical protein